MLSKCSHSSWRDGMWANIASLTSEKVPLTRLLKGRSSNDEHKATRKQLRCEEWSTKRKDCVTFQHQLINMVHVIQRYSRMESNKPPLLRIKRACYVRTSHVELYSQRTDVVGANPRDVGGPDANDGLPGAAACWRTSENLLQMARLRQQAERHRKQCPNLESWQHLSCRACMCEVSSESTDGRR